MMNSSLNRFWYCAIALCLLFSSCDKEEEIAPSVPKFITSSEISSYAGELVEVEVTDFDQTKHTFFYNEKEITDYSVNTSDDKNYKLSFLLPFKMGSGKLSIHDGTVVILGPQVNYQKQFVRVHLAGYLIGFGMSAFKDDKLIAWNPLGGYLNEVRLISVSNYSDFGLACSFGYKQHPIILTGPAVSTYDRLTGIGVGVSGKIHFFQKISGAGNVIQTHLFTSDLSTTTEYSGGIATGQVTWVSDLKLDSKENIFTIDYQLPYLRKVTPSGVTVFAGSTQAGHVDATGAEARFTSLTGLAIDKSDNVYVSDGNCVRMITISGNVTTITGAVTSGDKAGLASEARYNRIAGIAIGKEDQLYLLDNDNNKLKILSTDRKTVTTLKIAGDPSIKGNDADFNIHMSVDSKSNIYYMIKNQSTHTVTLMVLVNEDNLSEAVFYQAITSSDNIISELVLEK